MSNGWTDQRNRTIINFLIFCPQGTIFLKSVDAYDRVKDGLDSLFNKNHEYAIINGMGARDL